MTMAPRTALSSPPTSVTSETVGRKMAAKKIVFEHKSLPAVMEDRVARQQQKQSRSRMGKSPPRGEGVISNYPGFISHQTDHAIVIDGEYT